MPGRIISFIQSQWQVKPLQVIMLLAILFRLIAVVFSKGYGMHDDHFLVVETAQSWLDGESYNNWFLESREGANPTILNFFYAGLHYLLFSFLQMTGIFDPQIKMLIVRLLHAIWSLLTVYAGYKLTQRISDDVSAGIVGLLLAVLWLMPFFSVRNLVEFTCIPFLLLGFWQLQNAPEQKHYFRSIFLAGLMFGFAFTFRFQTAIFIAGAGLVLLWNKKIRECFWLASGFIIMPLLMHGLADWIIWHKPFAEFREYISHNIEYRFDYNTSPWYSYILVLIGVLIPPISLILLSGFLWSYRKHFLLFLPTFLFLVFHSAFPNKQERFILPALPFIIILGVIGWQEFRQEKGFTEKIRRLARISWSIFWVINIILLLLFSTMYSKKARVESMTYLSRYQNIGNLLVDDPQRGYATHLPKFYLAEWPSVNEITKEKTFEQFRERFLAGKLAEPDFILFFTIDSLDTRVGQIETLLPLEYETTIRPGFLDRVINWLNPVNANETVYIYRNTHLRPGR